jgi:formamidopyrimidine-DNA glycosylase
MPELPEVQTTVDGLNATVKGLRITDVWTAYKSGFHSGKDNIKDPAYFTYFKKNVIGKKIKIVTRRAKNILIHTTGGKDKKEMTILVHMKMTGHILYGSYIRTKDKKVDVWESKLKTGPLADPFNKFIRLVFSLSNGKHLALSDMRKFAKVTLIPTAETEKSLHLMHLGVEPFDPAFTYAKFKELLFKRANGRIKNVLMDQTLIAGVGNIYSDEALWRAGINPEERVENAPEEKLKVLYKAVIEVLKRGIDFGGDSMSDYRNIYGESGGFQAQHQAYRRTGKPCTKPGCNGIIARKVVGGRSAHFCSVHQKLLGSKSKTKKAK